MCVCVCVCVCARAHARECMCACLCVCKVMRERRGGGKGGGCKCWSLMVKVHRPAQFRSFRAPPPSHHLTIPFPFPSLRPRMVAGVRFRVPCRETVLCNFDQKRSSLNSSDRTVAASATGLFFFVFFLFCLFFVGDFSKIRGK